MFGFFFNIIYWLLGAYFVWSFYEIHKDEHHETLDNTNDYYEHHLAKGWFVVFLFLVFFFWPVYLVIRFLKNK